MDNLHEAYEILHDIKNDLESQEPVQDLVSNHYWSVYVHAPDHDISPLGIELFDDNGESIKQYRKDALAEADVDLSAFNENLPNLQKFIQTMSDRVEGNIHFNFHSDPEAVFREPEHGALTGLYITASGRGAAGLVLHQSDFEQSKDSLQREIERVIKAHLNNVESKTKTPSN